MSSSSVAKWTMIVPLHLFPLKYIVIQTSLPRNYNQWDMMILGHLLKLF